MPEFAHIGPFFANYEQLKLDEKRSIVAGIEDGMKIYSDSVMVKENMLFKVFDQIMNEDSNFVMMLPSAEVWNEQKQQASSYFNYGNIEKADSISNYWNHVVLLQDLFWNKNSQRSLTDSIFTTSFTKEDWPYHVYYNPYQAGGYLDAANITDSISCSNGMIYRINQWPFTPEQIYFHPVIMEGEKEEHLISSKDCTVDRRKTSNKNVSKGGYLDIVPRISTVNWTAEFEIKNNLSGTYDICIVTLPKTVHLENSRDQKPNKFKAVLHYVDENGAKKTYNFGNQEFSNNGETIDTVSIGKFTFPVSNYKLQDATVSLELKCSITTRQTSYSREMYLDCIYLKPSEEEDTAAATKARKEVRK